MGMTTESFGQAGGGVDLFNDVCFSHDNAPWLNAVFR